MTQLNFKLFKSTSCDFFLQEFNMTEVFLGATFDTKYNIPVFPKSGYLVRCIYLCDLNELGLTVLTN
jgi:hypothetical protein